MEQLNKIVPAFLVVLTLIVVSLNRDGNGTHSGTAESWFQSAVLNNSHPVVVKFGAEWCGPCRSMDHALSTLEGRYSSRARFLKINIDEKPELFQKYGEGTGIPQIMVFRGGKVVAFDSGFGGTESLNTWLSENL